MNPWTPGYAWRYSSEVLVLVLLLPALLVLVASGHLLLLLLLLLVLETQLQPRRSVIRSSVFEFWAGARTGSTSTVSLRTTTSTTATTRLLLLLSRATLRTMLQDAAVHGRLCTAYGEE